MSKKGLSLDAVRKANEASFAYSKEPLGMCSSHVQYGPHIQEGDCENWNRHAAPTPEPNRTEILQSIATFLRNRSAKLFEEADGRRPSEDMRNASAAELKESMKLAEKMMGHKLTHVSADPAANKSYCDMQDRIATKLETEARRLSEWANFLTTIEAGTPETPSASEPFSLGEELLGSGMKRAIERERKQDSCHDQFGHNSEKCQGLDSPSHTRETPSVLSAAEFWLDWLKSVLPVRAAVRSTETWACEFAEAYAATLHDKLATAERERNQAHLWKLENAKRAEAAEAELARVREALARANGHLKWINENHPEVVLASIAALRTGGPTGEQL